MDEYVIRAGLSIGAAFFFFAFACLAFPDLPEIIWGLLDLITGKNRFSY